ncbi:MAG: 2OG-Fe(II) oxygenase [Pseudomonadales bacterium]|nr:2OG-Fe(II) oxygenase [Pseudomonadales bacterium]
MSASATRPTPPDDGAFPSIAERIAGPGWAIQEGFVAPETCLALAALLQARHDAGLFRPAGIGRGPRPKLRPQVRSDLVHWIEDACPPTPLQHCLDRLEALRQSLNRTLFAGLTELETHLTLYPRGAFYAPHLDQFATTTRRRLSVVLYLNRHWRRPDGGLLRLWTDPSTHTHRPQPDAPWIEVLPEAGTLVVFRSADFWHEVRRARRTRLSLTGWFLVAPDPNALVL